MAKAARKAPRSATSTTPRTDAITHVGGPTVILDYAGLRLVSDPTFDPAGTRYRIGKLPLAKLTGPALSVTKVGKVDAVLLSHDTHADNFDNAGRALASKAGVIITTKAAAGHLPGAIGLRRWRTTTLKGVDGVVVTIMATPARHAAWGAHFFAGPVTGFLVTAPKRPAVYITGDNVSRRAIARVARRAVIDVAILHAGAPKFQSSGPIRYCLTAKEAARAARVLRARRLLVVHAEGWGHFSETEAEVDAAFSTPGLRSARIVAPKGTRVEIQPASGF